MRHLCLIVEVMSCAVFAAASQDADDNEKRNPWLTRFFYQPGWVHPTSDFVRGDNASGEPIVATGTA